MRYLIKILLATTLLFSACSEDFLDKKPLGQLTSDNFFTTEDHAVWATNATYEQMRNFDNHVFSYLALTDIISDDSDKGSTPSDGSFLNEIDNFTFDASNITFGAVWKGYFRGIYRANIALENIPNIEVMDEDLRTRLMGENYFLRAYHYFKLVRWFGELPLIDRTLGNDEYEQERRPVEEIYAFIEEDLRRAQAQLPARYFGENVGRATSGAATGLLSKVYLTQEKWQEAADAALTVINSGEYALLDNYSDVFTVEGENSSESVFEVQAAAFETGGGGTQYNEVQGVRGTPNLGWGFNRPSDDLVQAFEPGDPRREATILYVGEVLPDGSAIVEDNPNIFNERYNQKAFVVAGPGGNGNGGGNIRVLRYADVLLIAAEALNELGRSEDALTYLNQVRARARGMSNFILPDIETTDQSELRPIIWRERRAELAMEQQRWFDLVRQNRAASVMQAVGKDFMENKHELLPIPQSEIDVSGGSLSQNPGY